MDIMEHLGHILDLEKEIYTLNNIIGGLSNQSQKLGKKRQYQMPAYVDEDAEPSIGICFAIGIGGMVIGAVVIFIIGVIANCFFYGDFTFEILGKGTLLSGVIFTLLGYPLQKRINENDADIYQRKMREYENTVEIDNQRVKKELQKKRILDCQIEELKQKKKEVTEMLQKLYEMNVLYPKYRYFVAVATIYEYFDSGRCNSLEGHEGAYNIFENEIRMNVIINRLSEIISNLESIRDNQMIVYNLIKESNRISNELCNNSARLIQKNEEIAENTALTAYNSRIAAINTEILKYINYYK